MNIAKGLNTIVVATDLNSHSEAALDYARRLAEAYEARIVLAHGIDPLECAVVDAVPESVLDGLTVKARTALDQLSGELLRDGIPSHSEIRQGAVAAMLLEVIRQYDAGLIVIGTKGLDGAGPVVMGALAEGLVRQSPCPVLAVAEDWNAGEFRPAPGGPVLLAMEKNEAAPEAVATAYSLAQTFGRTLLVLHVRTKDEAANEPDPCANLLEGYGLPTDGAVEVRCIVKEGNPAEAIAAGIVENQPCVLVAGVKRASKTPGPHGTAFTLLAVSRVPVLLVPPETVTLRSKLEACAMASTCV